MRGLPQVRREVAEGLLQGVERGLDEVALGPGVPTGAGEAVLDAAEREHLLHHGGAHDAGPARRGHQPDPHGAALARHLHRHRVREADLVPPVPPPNGDEAQLGCDDAAADGGRDLLGALRSQADVAVAVTDQHVADKAVGLTSGAHLLHRVDLHHLVLERARREKLVDDLVLLDGQGMQVDVFDGRDLPLLHEAPDLGAGHPLLLLGALLAALLSLLPLLSLAVRLALAKTAFSHHHNRSSPNVPRRDASQGLEPK
mmetsp:Transcript_125650/g.337214  ORF Transcript_125650/g.337214 Transcript_125650/m.337214 type:complete len:257 (+) Transcript_125650:183-953(+)